MDTRQQLLYFCHSWFPEHVDLNIAIWEHLWAECRFLVDHNEAADPPYFVSRIEDLIGRADCLVAFVPPPPGRHGEAAGEVSPYVLFEIALAERAGIPRLVVVDQHVRMNWVVDEPPSVRCLSVDFAALANGSDAITWRHLSNWLAAVGSGLDPQDRVESRRATLLIPPGSERSELREAIEGCLRREGYLDVACLPCSSDVDAVRRLRHTDLLVADVGSPSLWDWYAMAHALAVPTIRYAAAEGASVPAILRGYEAGFEQDIVRSTSLAQLTAEVGLRARAILAPRVFIDSREEGIAYFERRRQLQATAVRP